MMFIFIIMGCLLFLMGSVLFGFEVVRFVDERKEKREEEVRREMEREIMKIKMNRMFGKYACMNEIVETEKEEE